MGTPALPKVPETRVESAGFSVSARIRTGADFNAVFAGGRRSTHRLMALHVLARPDGEPRLGLAISRRVDPRAVGRNHIKRVLRDAFRRIRPQLAPADYVVVARGAARDADAQALRDAFSQLLRKADALPRSASTGTMPGPSHDEP